ncbi:MAG: type II CRISPR RNA-guided endonuclease Cas9 [Porphyromonas sp.]|nr:type II CRISPR RNA-guided endonuclease Cas9 [Porphyromonas sp.]
MKKILGLDIGSASIGWAYVHEAERPEEQSTIVDLGVRVVPLSADEALEFGSGKPITLNADRRLKRSMRRNLQRYKLRRAQLIDCLLQHKIIQPDSTLYEDGKGTTYETLRLRATAATGRIELEELARVLLSINRKRGYRSSRKVSNGDEGVLIDGMTVAKELYNEGLTPGQWLYRRLDKDGKRIKMDFYRSDLISEFERIWHTQQGYHPEVFTSEALEQVQKYSYATKALRLEAKGQRIEEAKSSGKRNEKAHQALRWRSEAATQEVELGVAAAVLAKVCAEISGSSGYLGAISDRSKALYFAHQTVGQYQYEQIRHNPHKSLRGQVFYRQDYLDEFERIWETQRRYHPELSPELKAELRDIIIFYQRKLRSQKGLVSMCTLESKPREVRKRVWVDGAWVERRIIREIGPRVVARSAPIFQEFKIWHTLANVVLRYRKTGKHRAEDQSLDLEQKRLLFDELSIKARLKADEALSILGLSPSEWQMNYKELEGNTTQAALYKAYLQIAELEGCDLERSLGFTETKRETSDAKVSAAQIRTLVASHFEMLGISTELLSFDALLEHKAYEQQASYQLWHLLYSYEGDSSATGNERLYHLLGKKYGFARAHAQVLAAVNFLPDYAQLSEKAIRKLMPYMSEHNYSEACQLAGYRHSALSLTQEENAARELRDRLDLLPKGELRQPVVEKILNQMVNLVNSLIDKYSVYDEAGQLQELHRFDEIRIELARELKHSAKERKEASKSIKENTEANKRYAEILQREFGIPYPSRNDIIRYRLYQELSYSGYKDLYIGQEIKPHQLFSADIEIEHIIPRSRLFDDSFSNKTLAFRKDNLKKGSRTAYDYIAEEYASELDTYLARVEEFRKQGASPAKIAKLLKRGEEIGDGFIERDLRETQYIARKARLMLLEVSREVVATSGAVTDRLREEWGLTNLMKEMNLEKYKALDQVEYQERRHGQSVAVIKDWTKRDDQRHHAMDALTVAFTRRSHVLYLNTLNAHYRHEAEPSEGEEEEAQKTPKLRKDRHALFAEPMPHFRVEARRALERILVSHKAKNKVVTRNLNKAKGCDNAQLTLTPRGQLHKETVYAKRLMLMTTPTKLGPRSSESLVALIAHRGHRAAVAERVERYGSMAQAFATKTLAKDPLLYKGEPLTEVYCYEEIFTVRKPIGPDLKLDQVVDLGAKRALKARLEEYGGNAKQAFSDLEERPIWLNKEQGICLKSVTIRTHVKDAMPLHNKRDRRGLSLKDEHGATIPVDYVVNSGNHHAAIYRDASGKLQELVVSLVEAVTRANLGLPIVDRHYNKDLGWEFLFSLKQNEMFVFPNPKTGFDPREIELRDSANRELISPNLYRVQKLSSRDYYFRHHLETTVVRDLKEVTFRRVNSLASLLEGVKVRINHLGDIVDIGEY